MQHYWSKKTPVDLAGRRFGRLFVIGSANNQDHRYGCRGRFWRCRCDCGAETIISTSNLPNRKSCGCARRMRGRKVKASEPAPDRQNGLRRPTSQAKEVWWLCRVTRRDDPGDPGIEDLTQAADAMAAQRVMQADMGGRYRVEILRQAYVPDLQRFLGV